MRFTRSIVVVAFTAALLAAGLVIQTLAATQQGVNSYGVFGTSANSDGVFGQTKNSNGFTAGVYGEDTTSGPHDIGVWGASTNGVGVIGGSSNGYGVEAGTSALAGPNAAALHLSALIGADLIHGAGAQNSAFRVDTFGNIYTEGQLFSGGTCSIGCLRSTRERSYGTTAAVPTIEDTGEARLLAGAASVRLDPAFGNAIDARQGYVVLVTPEGDTRGLFVAERTAGSFTVRETMSGRSNIEFGYRIVAHPYGVREPRLPLVQMQPPVLPRR